MDDDDDENDVQVHRIPVMQRNRAASVPYFELLFFFREKML